jgi:hypothetical protein
MNQLLSRIAVLFRSSDSALTTPFIDFLTVGGAAFLFLAILMPTVQHVDISLYYTAWVAYYISFVINYPHFMYSYQLLYGGFFGKLTDKRLPLTIRLRYWNAGIFVPVLLIGAFLYALATENVKLMGYGANALFFFVGWHYIKQGYGVWIVLSVLKKVYYSKLEKTIFLLNAYAVWVYSWLEINIIPWEQKLYGVRYFTFETPDWLRQGGEWLAILTTALVVCVLLLRLFRKKQLPPVNAIVGYTGALYLWVLFANSFDAIYFYFIPMFHSLQYLIFVWKYKSNQAKRAEDQKDARRNFYLFLYIGVILGGMGFYVLPTLLDRTVSYDNDIFGVQVFYFAFHVFINVHHYFIDNVIWRADNQNMRKYLFESDPA